MAWTDRGLGRSQDSGRPDPALEHSRALARGAAMTMDCAGCPIAGHGCADCVVTVLFAAELGLPLDPQEGRAVATLREAGLISAAEASRARAVWVSEPRQAPVDLRGSATG